MREISKMDSRNRAITFVLTMPGQLSEDHMEEFERGCKYLKANWCKRFPMVPAFWKKEPQKRGAMHLHLLIYPPDDDGLIEDFRQWVMKFWHYQVGNGEEQHLKRHLEGFRRGTPNWLEITGQDFALYMAKYLGKDSAQDEVAISGRWWGMVNKPTLPYGEEHKEELPREVSVQLMRWAKRLRKKRAHAARIKFVSRKWGKELSVHEVNEMREGRRNGKQHPFLKEMHEGLRTVAREHSLNLGAPVLPSGGAVTLTFKGSVEMVHRWVDYLKNEFCVHTRNQSTRGVSVFPPGCSNHRPRGSDRSPKDFQSPAPPNLDGQLGDWTQSVIQAYS